MYYYVDMLVVSFLTHYLLKFFGWIVFFLIREKWSIFTDKFLPLTSTPNICPCRCLLKFLETSWKAHKADRVILNTWIKKTKIYKISMTMGCLLDFCVASYWSTHGQVQSAGILGLLCTLYWNMIIQLKWHKIVDYFSSFLVHAISKKIFLHLVK
jgi:hypothetical protein